MWQEWEIGLEMTLRSRCLFQAVEKNRAQLFFPQPEDPCPKCHL